MSPATLNASHPFSLIGNPGRTADTPEWGQVRVESTGILVELADTLCSVNPRMKSEEDVISRSEDLIGQLMTLISNVKESD